MADANLRALRESLGVSQEGLARRTRNLTTRTVANAERGQRITYPDGRTTGYLEFYDERHRPSFPLTSQVVSDYLTMIMNEPSAPLLWKAGRIAGWIEALMENSP